MIKAFGQDISDIKAFGSDVTKVMAYGEQVWSKQDNSLPDGYTACDYIINSSTSNGGVDLGFKFRLLDYTVEAKFKQDETSNGMVCGTFSNDAGALWYYNYTSANKFNINAAYSGSWRFGKTAFTPLDTDIHFIKYEGASNGCCVYHNGVTIGNAVDISSYANAESTENLFIFGRRATTNTYKGRIYYLKVWNTSTEESICDLVPCTRNSDSAAGFWDKTRLQFFTSSYWSAGFEE